MGTNKKPEPEIRGYTTEVFRPQFTEQHQVNCSAHRYNLLVGNWEESGGTPPNEDDWERIAQEEAVSTEEWCGEPGDVFTPDNQRVVAYISFERDPAVILQQ